MERHHQPIWTPTHTEWSLPIPLIHPVTDRLMVLLVDRTCVMNDRQQTCHIHHSFSLHHNIYYISIILFFHHGCKQVFYTTGVNERTDCLHQGVAYSLLSIPAHQNFAFVDIRVSSSCQQRRRQLQYQATRIAAYMQGFYKKPWYMEYPWNIALSEETAQRGKDKVNNITFTIPCHHHTCVNGLWVELK